MSSSFPILGHKPLEIPSLGGNESTPLDVHLRALNQQDATNRNSGALQHRDWPTVVLRRDWPTVVLRRRDTEDFMDRLGKGAARLEELSNQGSDNAKTIDKQNFENLQNAFDKVTDDVQSVDGEDQEKWKKDFEGKVIPALQDIADNFGKDQNPLPLTLRIDVHGKVDMKNGKDLNPDLHREITLLLKKDGEGRIENAKDLTQQVFDQISRGDENYAASSPSKFFSELHLLYKFSQLSSDNMTGEQEAYLQKYLGNSLGYGSNKLADAEMTLVKP